MASGGGRRGPFDSTTAPGRCLNMAFNGKIDTWRVVVLIIGIILIIIPAFTIQKCLSSGNWPTTDGEIITSELETHKDTGSGNDRGGGDSYSAIIEFEYYVEGTRYVGDRMSYRWGDNPYFSSSSKDECEEKLDEYPEGPDQTGE